MRRAPSTTRAASPQRLALRSLRLRESRGEFTEETGGEAPDPSLSWHWNHAISQELALLFGVNNVHLMSRIEETEFSTERFGNFTWVRCDLWRLWRNSNKHLHQEVARWHIGGI